MSPNPSEEETRKTEATPQPRIPDHTLLRCVGQGGYGEVWLAQNVMGTYRAVKIIYRKTFSNDQLYEREFSGIQKFEPISRTHPGLVTILHMGRNDPSGYFFYIMEVADEANVTRASNPPVLLAARPAGSDEGKKPKSEMAAGMPPEPAGKMPAMQINPDTYTPKMLSSEITKRGKLTFEESLEISLSLTSALGHLHQHGLIHRDIKPSNIIFVNGVPKIADIGLVTEIGEAVSYVGTRGYMPPEGPGSPAADIYSLGKVLYQVSTGQIRPESERAPVNPEERSTAPELLRLKGIILKACEENVQKRFRSTGEMHTALLKVRGGARKPQSHEGTGRHRLTALVFAELVRSSPLKQALGDREAMALLQRHHAVVRELLSRFQDGEEIRSAGDSFLLVFANPSDAVKFSLLFQARLRALAKETGRPVFDRIGIHVGEVLMEAGEGSKELHGMAVDICARVMSLAEGDQVLMTRSAFDNSRQVLKGEDIEGVNSLSWLNHGPYRLKGVEEPMEICEVGELNCAVLKPPPDSEKVHRFVSPDAEPVLGWRPALGQVVPNTKWVLEKKLGEGGFGEVWLGRHQTMKERRVFKFCFRADRVRSLKREVTLFRVLKQHVGDHPNIVGIQEVFFDEPPFYIVMDYAEAKDLRTWSEERGGVESVPLETRLEIVAQVADALQAAHQAGVIHRDVKPSNILVSETQPTPAPLPGGERVARAVHATRLPSMGGAGGGLVRVKLTDFGIGQVVFQEALAGMTRLGFTQTMMSDSSSSHTGSQMYMAPELLAGKPASTRSDIYSLGVVLYQLLVGDLTRPLTTDWAGNISDPVLRDDLKHCFAGDPQERFAEAGQLARNLRALGQRRAELARREGAASRGRLVRRTTVAVGLAAAVLLLALFAFKQGGGRGKEAPPVKLAVLPLVNLSGDVAQEYFANEMTDDLIAKLGQISALRVIGRASVMPFKKTTNSVPEIARQLNVDAVVQGTLKRELGKVQMAVWLFRGATDRPLWSVTLDRDLRDVFALQNEIALTIANKMKVKLQPEEQALLANAPRVNPEALDLYYRGKALAGGVGNANNLETIRLYKSAIEIDKDFAPAWAALAGAYINRFYNFEPEPEKRWAGDARDAVLEALRINPNLAEAYLQHGRLLWSPGKNFQHEAALELLYRALQSNPSSVGALNQINAVYNHTGFFDEAIAKTKEATALNPLNTNRLALAAIHLWKGEYEKSLALWPRVNRENMPAFCGSHWALALFALGQTNEAKAKLQEFLKNYPADAPGELAAMNAVLLAASGDAAGAIAQIKIAEKKTQTYFGETHHTTYLIACAYARLNKTPEALQWLKQTADTGFPCYPLFRDDPNLKSLRTDAGFIAFLQKQETDWKKRKADWAKFEDGAKRAGK